ncbi:sensor histidine kinase [Hippea alviniae]|uniref:sensor histidine kinase n=1 Tax=Hippea alviniae TaxID=1279027 RepID=UPI0003B34885|nr:HAMP domain-containing sensor histidine kinase [Hippea alviniae]
MEKIDLGQFVHVINSVDDLLTLYLRSLPVLAYLCRTDKLLFFKYSSRKKCFDLKVGIEKESLREVIENGFFNYDTDKIFRSDFNIKIRKWGSSCNDAIRSFVMSYVKKEVSVIKREELQPARFRKLFDELELGEEILYIPLIARGEIVGFLLVSPVCNVDSAKLYFDIFSCGLDKLLLKKSVENLVSIIQAEKDKAERDEKIYELGKTAMTIAHEMKNSLIGVIGLFDKLSDYLDDNEKAIKYRDIIKSQLNKLYNFTLDINRFSKITKDVKFERVDIADIIDNSIEMASTISDNVSFSVSVGDDAGWIYADKDHLEQVFLNLFKNSIEAKKDGKVKISVSVSKEGNNILIRIKDNCGGVDEETLKNMLKPFYTTKSYGTGLGLAIVKGIVENYEGEINFRNVPGGLECIIRLPIKRVEDRNGEKNHGS